MLGVFKLYILYSAFSCLLGGGRHLELYSYSFLENLKTPHTYRFMCTHNVVNTCHIH